MKNKKLKTLLIVFIIILILVLCFNVVIYAAYTLAATDVSYTKSNGSTISVKAALDEVYAKVPKHQIGDEVTVGGEQFYVLEWDNNCDTVNLISKYNLNTAGTAQQNAACNITACAFSSTNYWSSSLTSEAEKLEIKKEKQINNLTAKRNKYLKKAVKNENKIKEIKEKNEKSNTSI